jgi:hypothetical protein
MKYRVLLGLTATALAGATVATAPAFGASAVTNASAVPNAPAVTAANVSSAFAATSWQTNNTVWALAPVNGDIYVGGDFTSVRPPGDAAGTGEVARTYIAEFAGSGGAPLAFDPTLDGDVTATATSPNGSILYIGGGFTHVNGSYRDHLAAFNTSTGALITTWKPTASSKVSAIAVSPSGSTIYVGGSFTKLNSTARTYAGAFDTSGNLLAYAPVLNGSVTTVAVAADDSRVLVGGYFTTANGVAQQAVASTDPSTGASDALVNIVPQNSGCSSSVKDIVISGGDAYIAAEGTGGGCFDGDFAVNVSTGALLWQNTCLGATQALAVIGDWLYKGAHAHDCAYTAGGWPQATPELLHRLMNQSLTDGTLGHWAPSTNGNSLGPRVLATDGSQLFLGGDFTVVNNKNQQGFAIFPAGTGTVAPTHPGTPTVTSPAAGDAYLTFTGSSSPDTGTLTYRIYRDGGTKALGTVTATSWPWALPEVHYLDTGLTAGSTHTYQVTATTGTATSSKSAASAAVTVASSATALSYSQTVLNNNPSFFWRLGDSSGTTAADSSGHNFTGTYESGTTQGAAGPITGDSTTATTFDGQAGLVTSSHSVSNPTTFSVELWFKTTTDTGGKLIGFGNDQTGMSSNYDRQIYMMNDGQLVFGTYNNAVKTIETPDVYNDGKWHYLVGTEGSAGMTFYVDGHLIGTNSNVTPQSYTGYWRVGGDNLNGWNLDPWGSNSQGTTEPNSYYFSGTIGDVAVYPTVLSAAQVAAHYAADPLS